ncbi:MAG: hypothetical protein KGJ23_04240 [Euryarchaeota archaeon]|nr:hypothetical protein [Euryarchaeota archaeon]MDE1835809.1 hypothetical protein [Euryarchaeota archaeon]MDE1880717.1 hypothetical protein [Euryarchaeota archaeon]MDE2044000.1 hypothetical protein [Thermoplasmata archaeon]
MSSSLPPSPAPKVAKSPGATGGPKTALSEEAPKGPLPTERPNARMLANHRKWKQIEWAWTLIPVGLLLAVALLSVGLLYNLDTGPTAFNSSANWHINVTGSQWVWSYSYTDPYASKVLSAYGNATSTSVLYVPQNAVVWLNVSSTDVIHDFNVPQLGVRIDAIPGRVNHYWFTIPQGAAAWTRYLVQCTEFCGQGHYAMLSYVVVVPSSGQLPSPA